MADERATRPGRDQAIAILRQRLDPQTLAIVRAALDDSDRLAVIRDAFLEGRDVQAVQMIRDLDPVGIRRALGVNSGVRTLPGTTTQISVRPQLPFRATHLVVSPSCAAYFNIADVRIGARSQFVNSDPVAADLFATGDVLHGEVDEHGMHAVRLSRRAEAWTPQLVDMPPCHPGQDFLVVVTNIDESEWGREFRGALLGQVEALVRSDP